MAANNEMQGTQQVYLPFVVAGRTAASLAVLRRWTGAPNLNAVLRLLGSRISAALAEDCRL